MTPHEKVKHGAVVLARRARIQRHGLSRVELVVAVAVLIVLAAIAIPAVLSSRESARLQGCQDNLRAIGTALSSYHDTHQSLPPAAIWSTENTYSITLYASKRHDRFAMSNWSQMVIPFTSESDLARLINWDRVTASEENRAIRTIRRASMACASDEFNVLGNFYSFDSGSADPIEYARGNYAINGGSQCQRWGDGSTADPLAESSQVEIDPQGRTYRAWGNGVAGFNRAFSYNDFTNGLSTLVIVDEVRAGIHPSDMRGTWALGHVGASVTWGHGANSDDFGPNQTWGLSDDIQDCGKLHEIVGTEKLSSLGMPCVSYLDTSRQATARSRHADGANVLFGDGSACLIKNAIDPGVWHAIHSRETPSEMLSGEFDSLLQLEEFPESEKESPQTSRDRAAAPEAVVNSIGIRLVHIPAGEFLMGQCDDGNDEFPPECPPHKVRLSEGFYLSAFEISQAQFETVSGHNPSWHVASNSKLSDKIDTSLGTADYPVEQVTWTEAHEFCERLTALPEEVKAKRRYRLPTEAEWEYACRGGSSQPYEWRRRRRADDRRGEAAGILPPLPVKPVGSYPQNRFGLYDMRGNVWEWCADWFDRDYYSRSPNTDPQGPSGGFLKVIRGGDWTFVGRGCKLSYPMTPPWKSSRYVGFRVVCEFQ